MSSIKVIGLALLAATLPSRAQEVAANPTRPSASDNAFLTSAGYLEVEAGWSHTPDEWNIPVLLKLGTGSSLELGVTHSLLQQPKNASASAGTPGAQCKLQWTSGTAALATVVHIDWPKDTPPAYTLYPVVSLPGSGVSMDATLGATFMPPFASSRPSYFYALAISRKLMETVGSFAEIHGSTTPDDSFLGINAGVSHAVSPRLVLDLALGVSLKGGRGISLNAGLTSTLARIFP